MQSARPGSVKRKRAAFLSKVFTISVSEEGRTERVGRMEAMDNAFIGPGTRNLYSVGVGSNAINGSDSLANKDRAESAINWPGRSINTF